MKTRITLLLLTLALLFPATTAWGADGPSAFAKRTQKEIMAYLRDAGYAPQIDEDGDILFTYQELKCYISLEDGDEGELFTKTFLLFSIPEDMTATDEVLLREAINKANEEYRMVKCYYTDTRILFMVDSWIRNASDYTSFFKLYMRGLHYASNEVMYGEE
ncbi:MAG TPA: YbjN domain-containing protein [Candidatus Rikenella faecigallinarum]|uniref:YbjN domain-containing protein n=1 Tax=Candidatus Rikenella faecigallinarum TaxID=2838745 RepID=A0A9D1TYN1_9BACT|nr:YbjN domain-containing protein [Candidatus Rikenella faecigallinarum]